MIEQLIKDLIAALDRNTEALNRGTTVVSVTMDSPEPEQPAPAAEIDETLVPTKVPTPKPKKTPKDDTPAVPARQEPGQPAADAHVDVDEVIGQINTIVKKAILASDDQDAVKAKWTGIREKFGVERIAELRSEPAKLLAALKAAQSL